jgi:hypothetical protein
MQNCRYLSTAKRLFFNTNIKTLGHQDNYQYVFAQPEGQIKNTNLIDLSYAFALDDDSTIFHPNYKDSNLRGSIIDGYVPTAKDMTNPKLNRTGIIGYQNNQTFLQNLAEEYVEYNNGNYQIKVVYGSAQNGRPWV